MIVYFYERLSDGLNRYVPPTPTPSRLNISFFVSNGYLVFAPDIAYTIGYPGRSAEEYVNSGVEYLKKNDWIDGERIGIQGQSWRSEERRVGRAWTTGVRQRARRTHE